jgi:hypothetical protein
MPIKSKSPSNAGFSLRCALSVEEEIQFQLNGAENVMAASLD